MAPELKLWVDRSLFLCIWLSTLLAHAQVIGRIGTKFDDETTYVPINDTSLFYLNVRDPASTDGIVSNIRYCYKVKSESMRAYDAKVGFYQYRNGLYSLSSSLILTANRSNAVNESNIRCDDMRVPEVEVREGEVIGICFRNDSNSFGAFTTQNKETLDPWISDIGDEENALCSMKGMVPTNFSAKEVANMSSYHLLISADIQSEQGTDPPDSTLEAFILAKPVQYGLIGAGGFLFLCWLCLVVCCCCCCCIRRSRKRRSIYIQYTPTTTQETERNSVTLSDEIRRTREAKGKIKPHYMGPENFSSSMSAPVAAKNPGFQKMDTREQTDKGVTMLDTTAVVYSELLAKDTSIRIDNSFRKPSTNEEEIYVQLENCGSCVIRRGDIDEERGIWKAKNKEIAVRLRQCISSEEEKVNFLQEAAILIQLKHANIITFYGVLVDGLQVTIVEESLREQLKTFLKRLKTEEQGGAVHRAMPKMLLNFSQQTALGMKYLSQKGIVHGKVMASNVMLSTTNVCKITDFDTARDIANGLAHCVNPLTKWSAPEVIDRAYYTTFSDVWSYGCLLYEMWSLGRDPFAGESSINAIELIKIGWRLCPPPGCPKVIYELMIESWNPEPDERPSFSHLVLDLTRVETLVLNIPQKLLENHPECSELGGSLSFGKYMYKNLQTLYQSQSQQQSGYVNV